ncbi:CDP-glycerol glycerophosphotransferase family protein [Arthrobacter sp. AOP36-A1-22]|uniref:CDP-glycerol glycerophosphotransferase family protein n=1 Tax=Arthrobacter sp. AOP36-A1-22 TaxID=3457684 RepID=UPI00403479DD
MSPFSRLQRVVRLTTDRLSAILLRPLVNSLLAARRPSPTEDVPFVVYFADVPSSSYQLEQWIHPLEVLNARYGPVVLLLRNPQVARHIATMTRLDIELADTSDHFERFVRRHDVRAVFYLNNNQNNFTPLRINGPAHVHLSHGESEKASMFSHQLKAYDYVFVAGQASRDRILAHVRHIDPDCLIPIGRPQLAVPTTKGEATDRRVTVLYAPTWEGDGPDMSYGSLASHGEGLVRRLLSDDRVRVLFRPHPKSGTNSLSHRTALRTITSLLSTEAARVAGHRIDNELNPVVSIETADVLVCDVSAMAMDALGLGKPLVLCLAGGLVSGDLSTHVRTWVGGLPSAPVDELVALAVRPVAAEQVAYASQVFGVGSPEQAIDAFVAAAKMASELP